ncbi:MAG: BrnT family toxin [Alphaproteobacteria bacterium]
MKIVFDPAKDHANLAKHGVSLGRAADMEMAAVIEDDRQNYGEARYRAFGFIDGVAHCLAFTTRGETIRAISLRRAHAKEIKRYAP